MKLQKLIMGLSAVCVLGLGSTSFTLGNDDSKYIYGENIFPNGDFSIASGQYELPSDAPSEGVVSGYGVSGIDVHPVAINMDGNTVLMAKGTGFANFFKLLTIESGATYSISFDYKVDGTTDNIGFAFWSPSAGNRLPETNLFDVNQNKDVTFDELENGWTHISTTRTFDASQTYDSLQVWMNVSSATIYLDNFKIVKEGTEENIMTGGDFEGFLDYAPDSSLPSEPNSDGLYGTNAQLLSEGGVSLENDGVFGALVNGLAEDNYQFDVKVDTTNISEDANLTFNIVKGEETLDTIKVIENGDYSTLTDGLFTSTFASYVDASAVEFRYSGTNEIKLDLIAIRPYFEQVFDPDIEYFESENQVVNGDFEAFDVGTTLSETQLEGAWGSVALDTPGQIVDVNGNKAARIGRTDESDTHTYSSMFLMTPDTIQIGDLIRFRYDYKLDIANDSADYIEINSCFVGGANKSYYTIDLKQLGFNEEYKYSSGEEEMPFPIKTEVLDNGFTRVTFDFQVSSNKIQWNSIRWIITPLNTGDTLTIDNVELRYLSEKEFTNDVTAIEINEGDQELKVGDKKQLTTTITPTDADETTLTWTSSNEGVAKVNDKGEVEAIGEGSTEIKVKTANSKEDSIIVTVTKDNSGNPTVDEPTGVNGGLIAGIVVGVVVVLAAIGFAVYRVISKKRKKAKEVK